MRESILGKIHWQVDNMQHQLSQLRRLVFRPKRIEKYHGFVWTIRSIRHHIRLIQIRCFHAEQLISGLDEEYEFSDTLTMFIKDIRLRMIDLKNDLFGEIPDDKMSNVEEYSYQEQEDNIEDALTIIEGYCDTILNYCNQPHKEDTE